MKTLAAVLYSMGQAQPYGQSEPLVIEELELEGPGPGEVLVEIVRAGLCHSDLSVIDGNRPRIMPMILGHEASGVVREVGRDVRELAPGDGVVFSFVPSCGRCVSCASARPALCDAAAAASSNGTLLSGATRFRNSAGHKVHHLLGVAGFSHFTVAAQESLIPVGPDVPLEKAALFGCAVLTGVGAVVNTAQVEPGASVVVFGLGGVGLSVVMGARLAGAHPIVAVDMKAKKLDLARRIGATHVIDASTLDSVSAVREVTGGGAWYAFECVGSERVLEQAYQATRRGGTTVTTGLPHPSRRLEVPALGLVAEERTLKGSYMGSCVPRRDIPRFLALYQAGKLPVDELISGTIGLNDINRAFDALSAAEVTRQLLCFSGCGAA
jgi:alcohol dehydrogenase